ncbi:uncharacterized protein LOC132935364 [Metopolophium dirhodum]|uniref:uncharacterized protein LOC132935364 n=1 Tax=Metopolophium dirhodum TaxID=44670 RepID=UPI0029901668|nr:uncharacterized protein LOC132935364 [Metopolophium dirhodum]XP_060857875.1 uncharacterized protein LOC132935364 [Metopolophium dirhodum]
MNDYGDDESNNADDNSKHVINSSKMVVLPTTNNNEKKKNETLPNPAIDTSNYSYIQQDISSSLLQTANNEKFQKTIINYLAFLKVEVCKISNRQEELFELFNNSQFSRSLTAAADESNFEIDYFVSNWPISDINGINYMEDKMKSDNSFQKLIVCELARTGGKSLPNMIYKILKKVFTDKVLTEYTYYGLRNKNNFSILSINKAIFEAIKKSKFKSCCDDEVITAIGKWLTSAKGRLEKKNQQL